jgi:thiol-disulfide isomerase/thioredoxin
MNSLSNILRSVKVKRLLSAAIFLFATLTVLSCEKEERKVEPENQSGQSNFQQTVLDDNKAPNFTLKNTKGEDISLSDYVGKIVILDFWATWCGPCRVGIPDLVEIQNEYKDQVVIIGISLDQDNTKPNIIPFIEEYKINYPVVYGTKQVTIDYGYIQAIPTTFIIDKNGDIVDRYIGLVSKSHYINKIKDLLSKS